MHKKPDVEKITMPDVQCSTCFFYREGKCHLHGLKTTDQERCDHYQFDALCVDCGCELGESSGMIDGMLICQCVACGSITVGPAGIRENIH